MLPRRADEGVDHVVVDGGSGDDAACRGAVLSGVHEPGQLHARHHGVEVGIVEDDDRRLAPELQMDTLQRPARGFGDGLAGGHRPGERDHVHARVLDQGGPDIAGSAHHVEDARGQHIGDELSQLERAERGQLAGLEHDRAAGGQGGTELPDRHHEGVVPRGDRGHHADRVAPEHRGIAAQVLTGCPTFELAGTAGEEAEVVDGEADLFGQGADGFADVA